MKIQIQSDDTISIPNISSAIAEKMKVESGDVLILEKNEEPYKIITVVLGMQLKENILLVPSSTSGSFNTSDSFSLKTTDCISEVDEIIAEIISSNHQGVLIEDVRKKIVDIEYFIQNSTTKIQTDDREIEIKLLSNTHQIFSVSSRTRIKIKGTYIPSIEDIGGQKELKDWYINQYLFSLKASPYLKRWQIPSPKGLLLSGAPGLGKTHFLKAMIADSGVNHISIFAPNIITPLAGDGDMVIMETFAKARKNSPTIISIDEIDALCLKRSSNNQNYENRVVTVLLQEMDGVLTYGDVFVIGTTNRPEVIDPAFLRPGRLSTHIKLSYPDINERIKILKIYLRHTSHQLTSQNLKKIAEFMNEFTGSEIANAVYQAGINRIKKHLDKQEENHIIFEDFQEILPS